MSKNAPFKFDVVGSYLRPTRLKEARENFKSGTLTRIELRNIENEEIKKLIAKQKEAGLKVITDGEFRRAYWHFDFFWGLNGVYKKQLESGYTFNGVHTKAETASLNAKLSGNNHPFVEDYKFVHQFKEENIVPRQTIPAPAQFYRELIRDENIAEVKKIYPDFNDLFNDIIISYRQVIQDLYDAGCRNVQLDDCSWGSLVDKDRRNLFKPVDKICSCHDHSPIEVSDFIKVQNELVNLNNGITSDFPEDLVITTHVCRGNFSSTWFGSGGYESVSDVLFGKENVEAYYLEFDTDRAGGFEPLSKVTGNKQVVLGLISSKVPELEKKEDIISRIHEASKYIPLERLALSTQCGFASTEEGNKLTEEDQWNKIKLVREVSKEVWG